MYLWCADDNWGINVFFIVFICENNDIGLTSVEHKYVMMHLRSYISVKQSSTRCRASSTWTLSLGLKGMYTTLIITEGLMPIIRHLSAKHNVLLTVFWLNDCRTESLMSCNKNELSKHLIALKNKRKNASFYLWPRTSPRTVLLFKVT